MEKKTTENIIRQNLLIISYYFPPMGTVGTFRSFYLNKYLSPFFNKSKVVTIKKPTINSWHEFNLDNIDVERVYNLDYRSFSKKENNQINSKGDRKEIKWTRKLLNSIPLI